MAAVLEIVVAGDPFSARDLAADTLDSIGFKLSWVDEWGANGVFDRSGVQANEFLDFGAGFAISFRVTRHTGGSLVRLQREGGGLLGGLRGKEKVERNMDGLKRALAREAQARGLRFQIS